MPYFCWLLRLLLKSLGIPDCTLQIKVHHDTDIISPKTLPSRKPTAKYVDLDILLNDNLEKLTRDTQQLFQERKNNMKI